MLEMILIGAVVLIAAVLLFAATKPNTFRVVREATIKAPPEKIFPLIDDFQRWPDWSPYEKKDPGMTRTIGSTTRGKGAEYAWEGNKEVGKGSMEILESSPPSRVLLRLDFLKPFEAHNTVEFRIEPKGDSTSVTWDMYGPATFVTKLIGVFMDMDKMVGTDFDAGLARLRTIAEG